MCHLFPVIVLAIIVNSHFVAATSKTTQQNLLKIAAANDDFGYQLLHQLELKERSNRGANGDPENLFISPFSISTVLTMVLAGANEDTFEQIKSTLGFNTDMTESQLYTSFRVLLRQLNNFSSNANNTLELANAIALQSEYSLLPSYLRIVKNRLKAKIFTVNFQKEGKGKIDTILKENPTDDTRMVLLNALYFKGTWEHSFSKKFTKDRKFIYGKDKEVKVPMMWQSFEKIKYASLNE
ncbi:PREDICTED: corticosteroid-binding globulin-like, partial [Rhagoletis zephyria]|uniref:corticosteroid-binding globulin-like n=1 Tax=Rhagoletis zephyria TaxID=28612 RepID=UPI0008116CBD